MKSVLSTFAFASGLLLAPIDGPMTASAAPLCDAKKMGFAGLLAKCNREVLPPITLASGQPLTEGDLKLQSGAYYKIDIVSDGSAELALAGRISSAQSGSTRSSSMTWRSGLSGWTALNLTMKGPSSCPSSRSSRGGIR